MNDELQSRIQESSQLNSDLHNLMESANILILILSNDLRIRRFSPSAQRMLGLLPGDVGRNVGDLRLKVQMPDLPTWVAEVTGALATRQVEVADDAGRWYSLTMRPYKTLDSKIEGVVMTLVDVDQLKRREQQLEESRNYVLSIVETVREPLLVLDGNLRVRDANRAFYELFRLTPAETENSLIYDLAGGQFNIPQLRRLLDDILPRNSHFEDFAVQATFPRIGTRSLMLNGHRLVMQHDQPSQLVLLAIEDITDRQQAEDARAASEARLQAIVQTAAEGIVTIDQSGTIESFNTAAAQMFGYSAGEVIGQNVGLLMPSPLREQHDQFLDAYRRTGAKTIIGTGREVTAQRKDGTQFPIWIAVSEVIYDDHRLFTGMIRDITEEKRTQEQLHRNAEIVQRAEKLAQLGHFDAHIPSSPNDFWSEGLYRIAGLPIEDGALNTERYFGEIVAPDDRERVRSAIDKALAGGLQIDLEYRILRADGMVRCVRNTGELSRTQSGEVALLGKVHDITDLKQAQQRALQSERLAAIGQVSTGLAHESRNALQRSQACLEMLASEVEGQDRAMQLIARIQKAQDYLVELYEEVRDYAAPLTLRRTRTDLDKLLYEVWEDLEAERAGKQATLQVQANEAAKFWCVDPLRMRQVLRNIIENSLAACGERVEVLIRLVVEHVQGQARLRIHLQDNGPGLTPQQKQNVFAAFFTTKTHGTGLGMAIAKRIVEAHGGQLEVGSGNQPGAEFIIYLPEGQP